MRKLPAHNLLHRLAMAYIVIDHRDSIEYGYYIVQGGREPSGPIWKGKVLDYW
jgi:hypothetical protein